MSKPTNIRDNVETMFNEPRRKQPKKPAPVEQTESAAEPRKGSAPARPARGRIGSAPKYTSLAVDASLYEKLREIARINGLTYSDLVNAAMRKYIELYEEKYGPVEPPRESRISADSLI